MCIGNPFNSDTRTVNMKAPIVLAACAAVSGCATTSSIPSQSRWIQPTQAVELAAEAAPDGVRGVFAIRVQATGAQGAFTFLNSERDYRDQRNLTIAVVPRAERQLEARLGADSLAVLKGRDLLVNGVARRMKVVFSAGGKATDKYYYQTHVLVTDAKQISIQQQGPRHRRTCLRTALASACGQFH